MFVWKYCRLPCDSSQRKIGYEKAQVSNRVVKKKSQHSIGCYCIDKTMPLKCKVRSLIFLQNEGCKTTHVVLFSLHTWDLGVIEEIQPGIGDGRKPGSCTAVL